MTYDVKYVSEYLDTRKEFLKYNGVYLGEMCHPSPTSKNQF
jgi:hypothetical protein